MRCYIVLILSIFTAATAVAQGTKSFAAVDRHARRAPERFSSQPDSLLAYLLQGCGSEIDKVRSIYTWTATHIQYDQTAYKRGIKRINRSLEDILKRKKAVCFGYSQLIREFCRRAGIPAEVISGYSRASAEKTPDTEAPDHAWNAVKIDGRWQLLDVTWSHTEANDSNLRESYFLAEPQDFIKSHLPEDPAWQLLGYPVSIRQFRAGNFDVQGDSSDYLNFRDSLLHYERLSPSEKRLCTARRAYRFNPTTSMAKELSAVYLDHESVLNKQADLYRQNNLFDSLQLIQLKMIDLCDQASAISSLYPGQKENCAYNHFNYAVALASTVPQADAAAQLSHFQKMLRHFEIAGESLQSLPRNIFLEQALLSCTEYMEYCREQIRWLSRE